MKILIAGKDRFLSGNLHRVVTEEGFRGVIRTAQLERISEELKSPGRMVIIDVKWDEIQQPGLLRQLCNIARISGNKVICMCPNQEEDLKKLAKAARPDKVFIRYDIETDFRNYMRELN